MIFFFYDNCIDWYHRIIEKKKKKQIKIKNDLLVLDPRQTDAKERMTSRINRVTILSIAGPIFILVPFTNPWSFQVNAGN